MVAIIAGTRTITQYHHVCIAIKQSGFEITKVVSGHARGADRLGELWAINHGVSLSLYPANWRRYGLSAGHIRNEAMAGVSEALIALWDGKSRGTKDMIEIATKRGLKVFVYRVDQL